MWKAFICLLFVHKVLTPCLAHGDAGHTAAVEEGGEGRSEDQREAFVLCAADVTKFRIPAHPCLFPVASGAEKEISSCC